MILGARKEGLDIINKTLERMRKLHHERCAAMVITWLVERAKKKPVPDLPQRIERMSKEIKAMCEVMRIEFQNGTWVVKVNGSAEQTYKKLRLGTDWFEPNVDVVLHLMAGLDDQFGS